MFIPYTEILLWYKSHWVMHKVTNLGKLLVNVHMQTKQKIESLTAKTYFFAFVVENLFGCTV